MFEGEAWFDYLDEPMRESVKLAFLLKEREMKERKDWYDYSFIVFPMAKAYEGYLKKLLWSLGLISSAMREARQFRIGKSLNPDLPKKFRGEDWLFDDLEEKCREKGEGCKDAARELWEAWIEGRNRLFHYFSPTEGVVGILEAGEKLTKMKKAMEKGYLLLN